MTQTIHLISEPRAGVLAPTRVLVPAAATIACRTVYDGLHRQLRVTNDLRAVTCKRCRVSQIYKKLVMQLAHDGKVKYPTILHKPIDMRDTPWVWDGTKFPSQLEVTFEIARELEGLLSDDDERRTVYVYGPDGRSYKINVQVSLTPVHITQK